MPGTMTNDTIEYIVISFGSRRRLLAKPPTFELLMKRSCEIFDFTADTRLCAYFMYRNRCGELVETELDPSAYSCVMAWDELEWKALESPARASFQDGQYRTGPIYLGAGHERVAEDGSGHKLSEEEHVDDSPRSCSTDTEVGNFGASWDNEVINSWSYPSYDSLHDREVTSTPIGRSTNLLELIAGMYKGATSSPTPKPDNDTISDDGWPANDPRTFITPGCWPEDNEAASLDSNDQNLETSHLREKTYTPIAAPTTLSVSTATIKAAGVFSPRPSEKATTGHEWLHPIPSGPLRARPTGGCWAPDSGTPTRGRRRKHKTHIDW
ncbi:hypothetical protein V8F06_003928 [Rhypophila decipiens]